MTLILYILGFLWLAQQGGWLLAWGLFVLAIMLADQFYDGPPR